MGATLGNLAQLLQINYGEYTHSQTNDRTNVWRSLPMSERPFDGLVVEESVTAGYPATGGGMGPGGTFEAAGNSTAFLTRIYHSYLGYSIEVDIDLMKQSNGRHRFVRAMTNEVDRVRKFIQLDVERMGLGDGSGRLWDVTGAQQDTTGSSYQDAASTADGGWSGDAIDPWWFEVPNWVAVRFVQGIKLDWWDTNTGTGTIQNSTSGTVDKVLLDAGQRTGYALIVGASGETWTTLGLHAAGNQLQSGWVVKKKNAAVAGVGPAGFTTVGNEIMGLKGIIDNGAPPLLHNTKAGFPAGNTFQAITPSENGWWQSIVINANGAEISESILEDMSRLISIYGAESIQNTNFFVTHHEQVSLLRKAKYPLERVPLTTSHPTIPLGFSSSMDEEELLKFAGKPIRTSRFSDVDRLYSVPGMKHISRFQLSKIEFISGDGSMWHRNFQGRAAYGAEAIYYAQMGSVCRNSAGVIKGLKTISPT